MSSYFTTHMSAGLATSTASSRDEDVLTPSLGIALVMDTHVLLYVHTCNYIIPHAPSTRGTGG
jgi:hypothetical protein